MKDIELAKHPKYTHLLVSKCGRVFSTKKYAKSDFRELAQTETPDGYLFCKVDRDRRKGVHRLVLEAWGGLCPEGFQANHKDFDTKNNHIENLEWVSQRANLHHCMDADRHNWGRMGVNQICPDSGRRVNVFDSITEAERETGIYQANICRVIKGDRPKAGGYYWSKRDEA